MTRKIKVTPKRQSKRLGRGYGSGKGGHTSSRGQKGQKARRNIGVLFEGMKMKKSFIKRLPLRRGKGKFVSAGKPLAINLRSLNSLKDGSIVDLKTLVNMGIVDSRKALTFGVKVLGDGKVEKKLTINLPISDSAAKKVIKAGGTVQKPTVNA